MAHHLFEIVRVDGVKDVEEVLARRAFANRVLVGKVLCKFWVFTELRPQILDGKLVIMRDCDLLHLNLLQ